MSTGCNIQHLEGAQPQLDVQSGRDAGVLRQEGEHCVVHPKQRNKEQGGFSQPPDEKAKNKRQDYKSEAKNINYDDLNPNSRTCIDVTAVLKNNLPFFHK